MDIFKEVINGVPCSELNSFHPFWDNYVKLTTIRDCERILNKLELVKDNKYLFEREFSKNTTPDVIKKNIDKRLSKCLGANNSVFYRCTLPCGSVI